PIHIHGIDFVSSLPHIFTDHVEAEPDEQTIEPGTVLVVEPNAVSMDGRFGMFFGHTFIVTDDGHECVDQFPWELTVVGRSGHRSGGRRYGSCGRISGPFVVTATVCSKGADQAPSCVTAVQPSARMRTAGVPRFTCGSIASTMPGTSSGPLPPGP